jgi:HEAT repeat protein
VGDQRVADLLVPGLEDRDPLVRVAVLRALAGLLTQEGAARRLRIELAGERPQRRRAALYALARLSARAPEPELWGITDDPDPDVRLALIHSAAALCEEPEPLVRQLAADSDPSVRQAAEMWLLRATDPRS